MRKVLARSLCLCLLMAMLAGAQDGETPPASPYEAVVREMLLLFQQLHSALTGIRDEKTATDTHPELKKQVERFLEVRRRADAMRQPSREERERIARLYQRKLATAIDQLRIERARVQNIFGTAAALKELDRLEANGK